MPSKEICDKDWKKLGYSNAAACKDYKKPAKPQKASTSAKKQIDQVETEELKSRNIRMKKRLAKEAKSGSMGY